MTDYLWLLVTGWTVFQDAEETIADHIMFWVSDVTPQKAAARVLENRMEEAVRLKTQQEHFVDMISHEIRNPVSRPTEKFSYCLYSIRPPGHICLAKGAGPLSSKRD